MIIIEKLEKTEWETIYSIVNNPPDKQYQVTRAQAKKRQSLFDTITKDVEKNDRFDFSLVDGKDLILKEGEWGELKICFEQTGYPSMKDKFIADKIEDKIINAKTIEEKGGE